MEGRRGWGPEQVEREGKAGVRRGSGLGGRWRRMWGRMWEGDGKGRSEGAGQVNKGNSGRRGEGWREGREMVDETEEASPGVAEGLPLEGNGGSHHV